MTYIVLLLASIGSCFLIGRYLKLPKGLTYTFSIFMAIFSWQGYALLSDGYIDPFTVIASLVAVPVVLIIVIITDLMAVSKSADENRKREITVAALIALFLTAGPLLGFLNYTTSDSYRAVQDIPAWDAEERKVADIAIGAVREQTAKHQYMGLSKKSVTFLEEMGAYRVMFIFQGHELAEVLVDKKSMSVLSVRTRFKSSFYTNFR